MSYSLRNSLIVMDSTNPYQPTTTDDMEDDDDVDKPPIKTPWLVVILGGLCLLMALLQEAFYMMVISVSSSEPELEDDFSSANTTDLSSPAHALPELSSASAMAGTTGMYMALTARLIYLVLATHRPEVVSARRWCWIVSAVLIVTHILLCVWFGLHHDYAPLGMYIVATCLYTTFCVVIATSLDISNYTLPNIKFQSDAIYSSEYHIEEGPV